MERNGPNLVPASLTRVRCFLSTRGRMKVRPWAGAEETLDALHDALLVRQVDGEFWKDLESLLVALTTDMAERMRSGGRVVDNEVLDASRHAELLGEIRGALAGRRGGRGGFRALASSLSMPAVGLLAILGGVATLGCESATSLRGDADATADVAPDPSADPTPDPAVDPASEEPCVHAGMTLDRILADCFDIPVQREYVTECIDGLHASWRTGLEDLFQCEDCWEIRDLLSCLSGMRDFCTDPEEAGEYDLETLLDNCAVYLYLGVRFE